jgi:hypothetical protein
MKDELRKIGLTMAIIWEEQEKVGRGELKRIRTRCNNNERHNMFANISKAEGQRFRKGNAQYVAS